MMPSEREVEWTPFLTAAFLENPEEGPDFAKKNSLYTVYGRFEESELFGEVIHLSIRRNDSHPVERSHLKRIKNEVVGPEYDGIEIFPAEDKVQDTRWVHLRVLKDFRFPFADRERFKLIEVENLSGDVDAKAVLKKVNMREIRDRLMKGQLPRPKDLKVMRRYLEGEVKKYYGLAPHNESSPEYLNQGYWEEFLKRFGVTIEAAVSLLGISIKK